MSYIIARLIIEYYLLFFRTSSKIQGSWFSKLSAEFTNVSPLKCWLRNSTWNPRKLKGGLLTWFVKLNLMRKLIHNKVNNDHLLYWWLNLVGYFHFNRSLKKGAKSNPWLFNLNLNLNQIPKCHLCSVLFQIALNRFKHVNHQS